MPPAPHEVRERAAAVLKTVRLAKKRKERGVLIGLAPEGRDIGLELGAPPEGVGEFISLLVRAGLKILPAGVYEDEIGLVASFGEIFLPEIPDDPSLRDSHVTGQVMAAIKVLLPNQQVPDQ